MIILCVTGSIAATESIKLARELKRNDVEVKCFMSEAACDIITPNAMEFATGNEVVTRLTGKIEHVKYSQEDLILVAPATANTISKFAYKLADDPISTLLITAYGHDTPILFVPSMHDSMFKAVKGNIDKIKEEGSASFIKPKMDEGKAKFPDKEDIVLEALRTINLNKWGGFIHEKVLISMGGTYEPIDPIRGITNKSSGKMGLELAKQAYIRGFDVTLIVANVSVRIPSVFNVIKVETAGEMNKAIKKLIPSQDIFISTAAVSDFKFEDKDTHKIDSSKALSINLKPTIKIIRQIKELNPDIFLVGFKAEVNISKEDIIASAKQQIKDAGTDLVIANDVSDENCHFGSDNNKVWIVDDDIVSVPLSSKKEIANIIFDVILEKI